MTKKYLDIEIQDGQHDSVEDARATMLIYKKFEKSIENEYKNYNYSCVKS